MSAGLVVENSAGRVHRATPKSAGQCPRKMAKISPLTTVLERVPSYANVHSLCPGLGPLGLKHAVTSVPTDSNWHVW